MSKDQKDQEMDPIASRSDEESATLNLQSKEMTKKKKKIKCAIYIAVFAVFQTAIILLFALIIMRFRTPEVRIGQISVQTLVATTGTSSNHSVDLRFNGLVTVRNANFGSYRFDATNVTFLYEGVPIGQVAIARASARARSTKKLAVDVHVTSDNLGSEVGSGLLTLSSGAKLNGEVKLFNVFKKKKSASMDCILVFDVTAKSLNQTTCK